MAAHVCQDCGMLHDAPTSVESAEVAIARIQAEAQVKIAQLQARQDREYNETREEVAKIEAKADVAVAEAQADAIVTALTSEDTPEEETAADPGEPVVVVQDQDQDITPEVPAPPAVEETGHRETPRKKGLGLW